MKFNWDQSGMPVTLVSRLRPRNEFSEFKAVLSDAQNHVMTPVDAEAMARELVASGGREYVTMVRELATALADTKKDLEEANRRYERLAADLARRGVSIDEQALTERPQQTVGSPRDASAEWEEWNRKFESLLA